MGAIKMNDLEKFGNLVEKAMKIIKLGEKEINCKEIEMSKKYSAIFEDGVKYTGESVKEIIKQKNIEEKNDIVVEELIKIQVIIDKINNMKQTIDNDIEATIEQADECESGFYSLYSLKDDINKLWQEIEEIKEIANKI